MIRGVIFDLGGTLVDKYSLSPLVNLNKAFKHRHITLDNKVISKDMGLKKYDHIVAISKESEFKKQFQNIYNRSPVQEDLYDIHNIFNRLQNKYLQTNLEIIPEVKSAIDILKERNIKIGITTGFNKEQMNYCIKLLNKHNIYPDSAVSSTCKDILPRPMPHMIYENMITMGIENPSEILKVDDTCIGIEEGINAGCLTLGVARWSINMKVNSFEESLNLESRNNEFIVKDKLSESRRILHLAKPTYLINTLEHLHHCL